MELGGSHRRMVAGVKVLTVLRPVPRKTKLLETLVQVPIRKSAGAGWRGATRAEKSSRRILLAASTTLAHSTGVKW